MNKTRKLIKFIEELLNPDHEYNDKLKIGNDYSTDMGYVRPTHDILRPEANKHLNPEDMSSPAAKSAMDYSRGGYRHMNHILRHGTLHSDPELHSDSDLSEKEYRENIGHLKTLTKNPTEHEFYGYRGIASNVDHAASQPGDIIHDKGFTSLSLRPRIATTFAHKVHPDIHKGDRTLYRVLIKPGTKGHYLSGHDEIGGKFPGEAEFALHPGTKFRVGDTHVDLRGKKFTDLHIHSQED